MNKLCLRFSLVSCLLLQALCSIHVQAAAAPDRIRVGLSSYTPINAAIWIAE